MLYAPIQLSGLIDTEANAATDKWEEFPGAGSLRLAYIPAMIRFKSDGSISNAGVKFTKAGVCCGTTLAPLPVANLSWGVRYTGVLLQTNDVVYFKIGAASAASKAIHIASWSSYTTVDVDLKARCNALPTATTYDFSAAIESGRWEYLRIPYVASCVGGAWYVAAYSYSGDGGFNLVASLAKTSMEKTLRVGVEKNASTTELDTIERTLRAGSGWYYGMTEGQHFITRFDLYNNRGQGCATCGGSSCNICFRDDNDNSSEVVGGCNGKMYIRLGDWGLPSILGHELGHLLACLPDEYCLDKDVPGDCAPDEGCSWCGHTVMGWHPNNLCLDSDHGLDPTNACTTPNPHPRSNWATIPNIEFIPLTTPDNFNYEAHTFSAGIAVNRL